MPAAIPDMRLSPAPRKGIRQLTLHRGVRETAAQCFESGGDFNPISAEQLRQLGLGLFNEGAQGVPVDASIAAKAKKNPHGFAVLGLKVRKIRSVSPTNVRSAAASGFMADAIYTTS
jgi:hypothetical protein